VVEISTLVYKHMAEDADNQQRCIASYNLVERREDSPNKLECFTIQLQNTEERQIKTSNKIAKRLRNNREYSKGMEKIEKKQKKNIDFFIEHQAMLKRRIAELAPYKTEKNTEQKE
jgi:hypothetical protein